MRDRDQRLRWIEKLIGGGQQGARHTNALAIPTAGGTMAITFPSIEEVVSADRVKPFAFLPPMFCGVLPRGNELVPIIDVGGADGATAHVVVVQGMGCLLGLMFRGVPSAVDLDEVEHAVLETRFGSTLEDGILPVIDVDAAIEALLAQE